MSKEIEERIALLQKEIELTKELGKIQKQQVKVEESAEVKLKNESYAADLMEWNRLPEFQKTITPNQFYHGWQKAWETDSRLTEFRDQEGISVIPEKSKDNRLVTPEHGKMIANAKASIQVPHKGNKQKKIKQKPHRSGLTNPTKRETTRIRDQFELTEWTNLKPGDVRARIKRSVRGMEWKTVCQFLVRSDFTNDEILVKLEGYNDIFQNVNCDVMVAPTLEEVLFMELFYGWSESQKRTPHRFTSHEKNLKILTKLTYDEVFGRLRRMNDRRISQYATSIVPTIRRVPAGKGHGKWGKYLSEEKLIAWLKENKFHSRGNAADTKYVAGQYALWTGLEEVGQEIITLKSVGKFSKETRSYYNRIFDTLSRLHKYGIVEKEIEHRGVIPNPLYVPSTEKIEGEEAVAEYVPYNTAVWWIE